MVMVCSAGLPSAVPDGGVCSSTTTVSSGSSVLSLVTAKVVVPVLSPSAMLIDAVSAV